MTDIVIRDSDGRVQQAADTIQLVGNVYEVTHGDVLTYEPLNSFSYPTTLIQGVSNVPAGLVGGWNYNYVNGAFVSSGMSPPSEPVNIWAGKEAIPASTFISVCAGTIGAEAWHRIEVDPHGSIIFAQILKSDSINPNGINPLTGRNDFTDAINYMLVTNAEDGKPLLSEQQVLAINQGWPK